MGKQYIVSMLVGTNHTNSMYTGGKTLNMVRCNVSFQYYIVRSNNAEYIFRAEYTDQLKDSECGFSPTHRDLLKVNVGDIVTLLPIENYNYKPILSLTMTIKPVTNNCTVRIDTGQFLNAFKNTFNGLIVTEGFILTYVINDIVFNCELSNFKFAKNIESEHGTLMGTTVINCKENDQIILKKITTNALLFKNPLDSLKMSIGGMSKEIDTIFRRVFASRLLPAEVLGNTQLKHVRGLIISGPPGCGKTLLARQIGKLLNCNDIKYVNGPELLNMYVGESESNTRKLFEDAINDKNSDDLHLIICDEFDALCRQRGTNGHNTPVHDNVVNTLLSYIDGVNQLNNILMICMTNRMDLIDPAILRPGRLELHIEVSLPDVNGRTEILNIHTSSMKKHGYLDDDVNLNDLAIRTNNFTGAEIEGLIKNASSYAITRSMDNNKLVNHPHVCMCDFDKAFEEITPMYGDISQTIMTNTKRPLILWNDEIKHIYTSLIQHIHELKMGHSMCVLVQGEPYTGKTHLISHIIKDIMPPYGRVIDPITLIGKNDTDKCQLIKQIYTCSEQSETSIILLDSFERLINWCCIGNTFNNAVLQAILTLIRKSTNHKLVSIISCSDPELIGLLKIGKMFDVQYTMPNKISKQSAVQFGYDISKCEQQDLSISNVLHNLS